MGGDDLDAAAAALRAGQPVVVPTDTVYGVAALPSVPGATAQLFALKERSADQPLAVLVADLDAALSLVEPPSPEVRALIDRHWPGPLTLVLTRRPEARSLELGGDPATLGVRCPDHHLIRALADRVGPIATTSANRHGEPTPVTATEAAATLRGPVAVVLDGGRCAGTPSTVVDASGPALRVLRVGAIAEADLL